MELELNWKNGIDPNPAWVINIIYGKIMSNI